MESVRDQVKGVYRTRPIDLPPDWNRYPCAIEKQCEASGKSSCKGHVAIYVTKPSLSMAILEIIFFRPQKAALIRKTDRQLRRLVEANIIDASKLTPVS